MRDEVTVHPDPSPVSDPPSPSRAKGLLRAFSPYSPVIRHRLLRRVLPGMAVSSLGDGMAVVAISWLALQLAPEHEKATWVALALAAYALPASLGAVVFGRFLVGRGSAELVVWDSALRGVALGLIPLAYVAGLLTMPLFIALLATSSLLHSWGIAGRFTLIAEALPQEHHVAANALLTLFGTVSTIGGPPLAGLLISWQSASLVVALDAASFLILAVTYLLALRSNVADKPAAPPKNRARGMRVIFGDRSLLGLMMLTFGFFLFFGPVYVALPVHVADDLLGTPTQLALYYTAFGVGSVVGAVAGGYAGRLPLAHATVGIVVGVGVALLPVGLGAPIPVSLVAFAVAGCIWAPYMATSRALFQRRAAQDQLASALAANSAVIVAAVPLGTMLGGPLVSLLGAQHTLLASSLATIALGVTSVALLAGLSNGATRDSAAAD
ncbi:MFS transporter [Micromonospora marina]|uniref:MFS transporter n=1 Tax=Micromonospora marina TaxID=307120 RepID=UPI003F49DD61